MILLMTDSANPGPDGANKDAPPSLLGGVVLSVCIHGLSTAIALVSTAAVHRLSGRAIWGLFSESYRVREFSLYLLNAVPFYVLALLALALIDRRLLKTKTVAFPRLLAFGLLAVPLSVAVHAPLFPWSAPSTAVLAMFAVFYVSAYAVLCRLGGMAFERWVPFPDAPSFKPPAMVFVGAAIIYVGVLGGALKTGFIREDATLKPRPWPTPEAYTYKPSPKAPGGPRIGLLSIEDLPEGAFGNRSFENLQVLDIDGDGFMDVVFRDAGQRIAVALNRGGVLRFDEQLGKNIENGPVGNFAFADFDGDGGLEIIFDRPRVSEYPKIDSVAFNNII